FKGGWLSVWLSTLGAEVTGFALPPPTEPSFFVDAGVADLCRHVLGDVREPTRLREILREARPDVVFHLAAQSLVRRSYDRPIETLDVNVMGTAHLLEAIRLERRPCAVVVVTSDKCYENREWVHGYREPDPMGGHDVYSSSKGAAELVVQSWRRSFFPPARLAEHGVAVASARAGNVIGGGDWADDRLVPDAVRALATGAPVPARNPAAVRPWQHVIEPLAGYLLLGARLLGPDAPRFCEAWNFGPAPESTRPVSEVVEALVEAWGSGSWAGTPQPGAPHEAAALRLSIEKAWALLRWAPRWDLGSAVRRTVEWYRAREQGASPSVLRSLAVQQIARYLGEGGTQP
ncbi:MAG TPA: CDP-glucose 4,6-dehydratase, partial [Anaeromyxobacteraceae bacterium]|nr:CDP-glucose 4,6-dehydratase [Anaeromyxobacteraceae bacterium]